jgi:murein DD-endopeptidase MepM/ murein hydrolase activator NlpD
MPRIAVRRRCRKTKSAGLWIAALALAVVSAPAIAQEPTGGTSPTAPSTDVPAGTLQAEAKNQKVYFAGSRPAELSYVIGGTEPAAVHVTLVRGADGALVKDWTRAAVEPGVRQTLRWNGTAGGRVQRDGVYEFRVTATGASGTRASSSSATEPSGALEAPGARASIVRAAADGPPGAFTFLRYRFPLAAAHHYGEGAARFGGGRGHQGQDVFADCGTRVEAARGGVVKFKEYQAAAGNYVVIDGARTGTDFAYMHLRDAALVDEGDRVKTGQLIGFVGATGRASGCHLHFEDWTAPGWYSGGRPSDPLPELRAWDSQAAAPAGA